MATVITVASGKGGVGKSTATAGIAVALSRMGKQVLAMDMDIGLRNLDILLGLQDRVVYDLVDILEERCELHQAYLTDSRYPNLKFIAAPQLRDRQSVSEEQVKQLITSLRPSFDYILLDAPAGVDNGFAIAAAAADRIVVVATPELSSVRDADYMISLVETLHKEVEISILINRVRVDMIGNKRMLDVDSMIEILAAPLIGAVPEDEAVIAAGNKGTPVVMDKDSSAGAALTNVARRLTGEKVEILRVKPKGFFRRLFRKK